MLATLRLLLHYKAFYRGMFSRMFASWPEALREPLIDWHLRNLMKTLQEWPAADRTGEGRLFTELRNGGGPAGRALDRALRPGHRSVYGSDHA